jgi:hypothetical protein
MRTALALAVLARIAAADSSIVTFLQVAPSRDGGAWLLVRAESGELRRVAPDGTMGVVTAPTDRAIRAIATSRFDDSLWVVTDGPVLQRTANGAWRRILLPPEGEWAPWFGRTSALVTPIAPDRAVVFRGCGDACTDVFAIAEGASADARRFAVRLGPASADGSGGLWAVIAGGYAHLHDGRWDAWADGAIDRMTMHRPEIAASAIAGDGRGGAIAANDDELATIGADGSVTSRGSIASPHAPHATRAVIASGDEALVITEVARHDEDPSPSIHHIALAGFHERRVERVSTGPRWRAEHGWGADIDAATAGSTLWILSGDAVFYGSDDAWHTIGGPHEEPRHKLLVSAPLDVGLATRPSAANGKSFGLRPEMIVTFDRVHYPIYGFGPYAEAVVADGEHVEGVFGAGVTGIVYGDMWAVALSMGVDARYSNGTTHPQLAASAFIGLREYNMHLFDAPFGLRIDARPGTSDVPGSVTFSLAIDPVWFVGLGAYLFGKD